ncbi:MAG TPA: 3-oxoacid CoA-transferase subunit B [Dehalococcoidia bacterium]|jgi:3-oxoacid CoA-transferase subunit B
MSAAHPRAIPRELMVLRVCRELRDGMVVNLGLGIPTLLADIIPGDIDVLLHAENGVLGYGPYAKPDEEDPETINPGGARVTLRPGASCFDSAESFALVRGGHVDIAVLGALQVSERGDLANWMVPARGVGGIGGAMDLAAGAKRVIAVMEHVTKDGAARLVRECSYPLTARACVQTIVTDLAVLEIMPEGMLLRELAPGVGADEVQARSEPRLLLAPDLCEMRF